jgi:ribulose-phosphate 3-epimerase
LCWNAGANVLVAGSAVFKDGAQEKYQDNLNAIKNSCTK